jgi:hypothetical protein
MRSIIPLSLFHGSPRFLWNPSTLKNYQTSINFNQINSKENLIIRKLRNYCEL